MKIRGLRTCSFGRWQGSNPLGGDSGKMDEEPWMAWEWHWVDFSKPANLIRPDGAGKIHCASKSASS